MATVLDGSASSELCDNPAPPLHEDDVTPHPIQPADTLSDAYLAKAAGAVQAETGFIFREDTRLKGPDAGLLRRCNEGAQQRLAGTPAASCGSHVDTDFRDAGVDAAAGNRRQSRPAQ